MSHEKPKSTPVDLNDSLQEEGQDTPKKAPGHPEKITMIHFIRDHSGSMSSTAKAAMEGYNKNLAEIKKHAKLGGKTLFGETEFSSTVLFPVALADPEDIPYLKNYRADGGTRLYDAVGLTLEKLSSAPGIDGDDTSVLVVIISDGEENESRLYGADQVSAACKKFLEDGKGKRQIVYIGANVDLTEVSGQLGIAKDQTIAYQSTPQGTGGVYAAASGSTHSYLQSRSAGFAAQALSFAATTQENLAGTVSPLMPDMDAVHQNLAGSGDTTGQAWKLGESHLGEDPKSDQSRSVYRPQPRPKKSRPKAK